MTTQTEDLARSYEPLSTPELEQAVGRWTRAVMPAWLSEFVVFILKHGWASLYGGLILLGLIVTKAFWTDDTVIARYDAMLVYAIGLQVLFLVFRFETLDEARVIVLFHLSGTVLEIFKVSVGSWSYPDPGVIRIMEVPLFTGFMYAAVGSFMSRAIRLFHMRFDQYPPMWTTLVLAAVIYANFFTHHFISDLRWVLFIATLLLFAPTKVWFKIGENRYWMPMLLAGALTAFVIWVAENIGTGTETWLYHGQVAGEMVPLSKMGSWYLLIYVSFVTVTLVVRDALICRSIPDLQAGRSKQTERRQTTN